MTTQKISESISIISKVGFFLGAVIILIYCSIMGFYPQGLTLGDGLFICFVFISFGFLAALFIFLFSVSSLSLINTLIFLVKLPSFIFKTLSMTKKEKHLRQMVFGGMIKNFIKDHGIGSISLLGLLWLIPLVYILSHYATVSDLDWFSTVLMFTPLLYCGIASKMYINHKDKNIFNSLVTVFILLTPFMLVPGLFKYTLYTAMENMGVRDSHVSVYVDKQYIPLIQNIIDENDLSDYQVTSVDDSFSKIDNVNVIFTGAGDKSLLSLANKRVTANFVLPSDAFYTEKSQLNHDLNSLIEAIKSSSSDAFKQNRVSFDYHRMTLDFGSYGYFKVGESAVSPRFEAAITSTLNPLFDVLSQYPDQIKSLEVIGLSSEEWKGSKDDLDAYKYNYDLSVKRALAVSNVLFESETLQPYGQWLSNKLVIRGELSQQDGRDRKSDRRVVIKLNLNQ
ncbi:hypothetical protein VIM7927_01995 [Vibrio mangrovi]|uniref:OmpA-like domain-containing protein n=2 Tax=Vibrio mangrovi TaxID=474394 RepID=A0A1Y6ISX1_9VIBR|nr:hypothetical protein VIM7927_01995 [Vibrio mangrovi]